MVWYRKAADQGNVTGQLNLGVHYAKGQGVRQDYTQAALWFRKAADQGDAGGQSILGSLYAKGQGVRQDDAQAVVWYRKAADQGNAEAQYNLGVLYATGQGVPRDDAQAVVWYRKAADQGNVFAQNNLGTLYATGQGVPQDDTQAELWYRKAAEHGHEMARANLSALSSNVARDRDATNLGKELLAVAVAGVGVYLASKIVNELFGDNSSRAGHVRDNSSDQTTIIRNQDREYQRKDLERRQDDARSYNYNRNPGDPKEPIPEH